MDQLVLRRYSRGRAAQPCGKDVCMRFRIFWVVMMTALGWATPSLHGQSARTPGNSPDEAQSRPAASSTPATLPGLEDLNRITLAGTVMAVDLDRRTLTMQGSYGQVVTLDIPPNVGGLEQVKLGDNVLTVY